MGQIHKAQETSSWDGLLHSELQRGPYSRSEGGCLGYHRKNASPECYFRHR